MISMDELMKYVDEFSSKGIDKAVEAFREQQDITGELQEKGAFGKWEGILGALELSAYTALVAYKDGLTTALSDLMESGAFKETEERPGNGSDDLINLS